MDEQRKTATFIISARSPEEREIQVAKALSAGPATLTDSRTAVLLEGVPTGKPVLEEGPYLQVVRVAPGCMCCVGNITMRVSLNRLLRSRPERLFIGVASSTHLPDLQALLTSAPYDTWLELHTLPAV